MKHLGEVLCIILEPKATDSWFMKHQLLKQRFHVIDQHLQASGL
jgi:hypothetical protein